MAQGFFVLRSENSISVFFALISKLIEVIHGLSVDPSPAEKTGTFPLEFADDLPTADAIIHERVLGGLTVADLALFARFDLAEISLLQLVDLFVFGCFFALSVSSALLLLCLLLNFPLCFDSLNKVLDECLDFFLGHVQEATKIIEDRLFVLLDKVVHGGLGIFLWYPT